jgi:AbrB family looped-hinge helix DNA binding protein
VRQAAGGVAWTCKIRMYRLNLDYTGLKTGVSTGGTGYDSCVILESMRIGERGQVTIPKEIRDQFGLGPETEIEFRVVNGSIVLKKAPKKLNLAKWKGRCSDASAKLGYSSVDQFIEDIRGR